MTGEKRKLVGTIGDRHIFACRDKDSLWVEVAGPKGGDARQYAPGRARALAVLLNDAAHAAETGETPMSECNHELRYCWCQMDKIAWDTEQRLEAEIVQYREAIKKALTTMNATDWELGPGGIARKAYADLEHVYWAIPAERTVAARKRTTEGRTDG